MGNPLVALHHPKQALEHALLTVLVGHPDTDVMDGGA
jgi:hypothetical protein